MFAVFSSTVLQTTDDEKKQHTGSINALKDDILVKHFKSVHPNALVMKFESSALMSCSLDTNADSMPWSLESRGDIVCLFKGGIDNLDEIKKQKGWENRAGYTAVVIHAYHTRTARPGYRNLINAESLTGDFTFVLYDVIQKCAFIGISGDTYKLHQGNDCEGNLVVGDDLDILEKPCSNTCLAIDKGFHLMRS